MSMTDLTTFVLPAWAVPSRPRRAAIDEHVIHVREQWWRDAISARGLPGTPPARPTLTRAVVWAPTDEVFTLLWRTLAWGRAGTCGRTRAGWTASPPTLRARRTSWPVLRRSLGVILLARMRCCGRVRALEELSRCYHDVGHWLVYQRIHTPWPPL
jgi:hypothetical protein